MRVWLINGRVYQDHRFEKRDLLLEDGKIRAVFPAGAAAQSDRFCMTNAGCFLPSKPERAEAERNEKAADGQILAAAQVLDLEGRRVVPGFFDIHTHGSAGVDVNAASAEDLEHICRFQASQGVTSFLISILTDSREQTLHAIGEYRRWKETLPHGGARIRGIHLEGPFLAREYKGAMPEQFLRAADPALLAAYQQAAGGDIRYITVSPEVQGVVDAIPVMRDLGMAVAIGHSGADYETALAAIANGASSATHVGNAMRLLHQREPAIFGAVLESDDVFCEAICDGRHLHPGTVRFLLKVKGPEKLIAITDSIMAAGLPDGEYRLGVNKVIVRNGDAKLPDGTRAGSTLTLLQAFRNLLCFTGWSAEQLLPLLTENPARLLGMDQAVGCIRPGQDADLLVLDEDDAVFRTIVDGCVVFGE